MQDLSWSWFFSLYPELIIRKVITPLSVNIKFLNIYLLKFSLYFLGASSKYQHSIFSIWVHYLKYTPISSAYFIWINWSNLYEVIWHIIRIVRATKLIYHWFTRLCYSIPDEMYKEWNLLIFFHHKDLFEIISTDFWNVWGLWCKPGYLELLKKITCDYISNISNWNFNLLHWYALSYIICNTLWNRGIQHRLIYY